MGPQYVVVHKKEIYPSYEQNMSLCLHYSSHPLVISKIASRDTLPTFPLSLLLRVLPFELF